MSPLMIDIALWYYCRVDDYGKGNGDDNFRAPAVQCALKDFVSAGLLTHSTNTSTQEYFKTDALDVYVKALCEVRWPIQVWVIPKSDAA